MAKDIIITPLDGDIVFDNSSGTRFSDNSRW